MLERLVREVRVDQTMDVDHGAGRRSEAAMAGDVIGVVVGLEDVGDAHVQVARQLEVLLDLEARVDDGRDAGLVVADEVRGAAEVVVNYLSKDHRPACSVTGSRARRA